MQNLAVVSYIVCVHVEGSKTLGGRWGPASWDMGVAETLETRSYPTCAKFRRSMVKPFGCRQRSRNFGDWGLVPTLG